MHNNTSRDIGRRFIGKGSPFPAPTLVFLLVALIAILQVPISLLIKKVSLGAGIAANEILLIAGLPLLLTRLFHFDASRLFPLIPLRLRAWLPLAVFTVGMVVAIDYLTAASELILPLPDHIRRALDDIMYTASPSQFAYKFVLLCLIPGVCEELFFRGFCQTSFAVRRGPLFAVIVTGLLFATLHGNPWHLHLYFVLGCFLSWVYFASGTLWAPIACHIVNNAWTFTHHTYGTTLPWKHVPPAYHAGIVAAALAAIMLGGRWFARAAKRAS